MRTFLFTMAIAITLVFSATSASAVTYCMTIIDGTVDIGDYFQVTYSTGTADIPCSSTCPWGHPNNDLSCILVESCAASAELGSIEVVGDWSYGGNPVGMVFRVVQWNDNEHFCFSAERCN